MALIKCPECGKEVSEDVDFCENCGTQYHKTCSDQNGEGINSTCPERPVSEDVKPEDSESYTDTCSESSESKDTAKRICKKCGNELEEGQTFCPKCGKKIKLDDHMKKRPKKGAVVGIVTAVVAVIVALAVVLTSTFMSVDNLCKRGDYEAAFKRASGEEQLEVFSENVAAGVSSMAINILKDPSSFVLRDAYHYGFINDRGKLGGYAVVRLNATNTFGATVNNYFLYVYDTDENHWEYWGSCSTIYSGYFYDDRDFLVKDCVRTAINKGYILKEEQIERINGLAESGKISEVEFIDRESISKEFFEKG